MQAFLGIDVGTGSARAGLFSASGQRLASASRPLQMWKPEPDFVEQSSDDIWAACCAATREAMRLSGLAPADVAGIGFDATCSLVVLDAADRPVSVSRTGRAEQNVMVWMDHRAAGQAERINATRHAVLRHVGRRISPEMQLPKLLWLREQLPAAWAAGARLFDLPDYLTYRATGDDTRSLCTTVCKWTYLGHEGLDGAGWQADFFRAVGLGALADEGFRRIGTRIRPMGEPLAQGLTPAAAAELGLAPNTPVGVAIIDAHAGGLGLLGARLPAHAEADQHRAVDVQSAARVPAAADFNRRLALIGGTSSCHMAVSPQQRFIRGVWGPYHAAMLPGWWLNEAGQTATGALIDHIVHGHAASADAAAQAHRSGQTIFEFLNQRLAEAANRQNLPQTALLTRGLHVQPDFHGNRSPRADASLRGAISGLALSATVDDLALQYLAALQAVAYGTRHIIDTLNRAGYAIDTLLICGGGSKNPLFVQQHADITGCRLVHPSEPEAVLLGAAMLGGVAAGAFEGIQAAMAAMSSAARLVMPATGASARFHDAKYRVFQRMHRDFLAYRRLMADPTTHTEASP